MRIIWWRITRPESDLAPVQWVGDSLNIHLPEDQSPITLMQNGEHEIDRDWLSRLLEWSRDS